MNGVQIVRLLMRLFGNRMFRQALSRGIDRMARGAGGTTAAGSSRPSGSRTEQQARALGKRARDIAKITRRMR